MVVQNLFDSVKKSKVKKEKYTIGGEARFNGTNIITIQIIHSGKKAGKIVARNGGIIWLGKNKKIGTRISWTKFAKIMSGAS